MEKFGRYIVRRGLLGEWTTFQHNQLAITLANFNFWSCTRWTIYHGVFSHFSLGKYFLIGLVFSWIWDFSSVGDYEGHTSGMNL